jgi:hypothetical protein
MNKRFLNVAELSEYIGLGKTKTREFGAKHGAVRKLGSRTLYDRVVIDKVLDDMGKEEVSHD